MKRSKQTAGEVHGLSVLFSFQRLKYLKATACESSRGCCPYALSGLGLWTIDVNDRC